MDLRVKLASEAIKLFIVKGSKVKEVPGELKKEKAGVFVSIKKNGALRGCIGTFLAIKKNIGEEIINNAIAAATEDHRFSPITEEELPNLKISVDVLSEPQKIKDINELDPKTYGIIIKTNDGRSALLLPDLEGVDTVEEQINITCQKGDIDLSNDKLLIYKFTVKRYE